MWPGMPPNIGAAVRLRDGYIYFFKGERYEIIYKKMVYQLIHIHNVFINVLFSDPIPDIVSMMNITSVSFLATLKIRLHHGWVKFVVGCLCRNRYKYVNQSEDDM